MEKWTVFEIVFEMVSRCPDSRWWDCIPFFCQMTGLSREEVIEELGVLGCTVIDDDVFVENFIMQ